MESKTGCKIAFRGKVVHGLSANTLASAKDDPLHVIITGDEQAQVDYAAQVVADLLTKVIGRIVTKRINIPDREYPTCNFKEVFLNRGAANLKEIEEKSSCRASLGGKGINDDTTDSQSEPLHVFITGNEQTKVDDASRMVEDCPRTMINWRRIITKRMYIPVDENHTCHFLGRIIGPIGAKQMQDETRCKIIVRGKGVSDVPRTVDEPLHVEITGDEQTNVEKAASIIEDLLKQAIKSGNTKNQRTKKYYLPIKKHLDCDVGGIFIGPKRKELEKLTGCRISFVGENEKKICEQNESNGNTREVNDETLRIVVVTGNEEAKVDAAIDMIHERVISLKPDGRTLKCAAEKNDEHVLKSEMLRSRCIPTDKTSPTTCGATDPQNRATVQPYSAIPRKKSQIE